MNQETWECKECGKTFIVREQPKKCPHCEGQDIECIDIAY